MGFSLTESERKEIKLQHRRCKQRRFADRLKALLLLSDGYSCLEVGEILLLDDDTIRSYCNQYLSQGVASLLSDDNKGTKPLLSSEQLTLLETHLSDYIYPDSKGIIEWVSKEFRVTYKSSGMNASLKRIGFVCKKPVLVPGKANVAKQEAFVKEYQDLKQTIDSKDQIYFMDGVHSQHNAVAACGWIKKGENKYLKTNNGRKRINLNGALNLKTKAVVFVEDHRVNAQSTIALIEKIMAQQKEGKVYIILDNARYYHAKIVTTFLEEHPRVILKFLPPYAPNLNIIERLWRILKKKVAHNVCYPTFEEFRQKVLKFFDDRLWCEPEFDKTLTDNFQIINPDFSGSYMK